MLHACIQPNASAPSSLHYCLHSLQVLLSHIPEWLLVSSLLMLIHNLELENFKSYNGRHSLGPFDPHFTCVIGPNGNGKSNIIDAVLFVFGFKSSKLRQDSLAALIHRSAFARPDHASVAVTFREGEEYTSVTRTVLKSGHSHYRLNGDKIGWTELREKLVSKCIDLNKNLFIILQGEVERLCELSPDKMVEYLEYVSGSDEFKETIDQAEKKYVERSIVKEELRAGLSMKKKLFESGRDRAGQQATWMLLRIKALLLQHLAMKKIFLENHKTYLEMKEAEEAQSSACIKIQREIREKEVQLAQKRNELKIANAEYRKGEEYIDQVQQKKEKAGLKVKQANRDITFSLKDKESKQQERNRLAAEIQQLGRIQQQHEQLVGRIKEISTSFKNAAQMGKLKLCLELQQKAKSLKRQETILEQKCTEDSKTLLADKEKLAIYQLKYQQNKLTIIKCRTGIKAYNQQLVQIKNALTENEELLQQIERQINDKPNEKKATNQERIINQIRQAHKLRLLLPEAPLITLRELLIIDAAYADVVETILPHLDFFIVENLSQAKEVLDFLNKRKLGRMTLLIRQSIREATRDIKPASSCPKDTKLLYEVCKCADQEAKNILMWSLGNTLVTSKLDTAMKVAYYDEKRYRVITTSGEFIDSSGTMTKLPLKNGRDKEDQEFLMKKEATIKRVIASLRERKGQVQNNLEDAQQTLLSVENEERSLDGLDEVFLKDMEAELKENTAKLCKMKREGANASQNLSKMHSKLVQSRFNMNQYDDTLVLIKQLVDSEDKVKKIANCGNLILNLNAKIAQADSCLAKMNEELQQKVRQKSAFQTDKMRLTEILDTKRRELGVIQYGINFIQSEIKEIEGEKKMLEEQLTEGKKGTQHQPREELKKIRAKLRAAEMEKLELLSKLQESIKEIKEFAFIICKTLSKCPQLVHPDQAPPSQQPKQLTQHSILLESALVLGKASYNFSSFLNQKQQAFLLQPLHKNITYSEISDIRPSDADSDLLFESIPSKDVKFGHSFQIEKLKQLEKEISRGEGQFDLDFELFQEYREKKREFEEQAARVGQVGAEVEVLKGQLIDLRNRRLQVFLKCFNEINVELNKIYMGLTGGKADLTLTDSMNPFQGVQFSVRPVNKSWKRVNLLSGGQKTFTSLALIFACEEIKRFPFYFMDQIDAALDYRNTSLLAQYITSKKGTQHIVISLRKNMYQQCNRVVGVYKVMDQSRTVQMAMEQLKPQEETTE